MTDEKDRKILSVLRENAREPIRDIAKKTGLRPSTVHQRMQRMVKEGVIEKYTLKLNNTLAGEDFIVFMNVTTSSDLPASFFADTRIKEVFGVTGEYDLLLKLKFKDINEFNGFLIGLRKRPEIVKTITTVATINLKEEV